MTHMCFICWGDARQTGVYGDWDERDCPGCGRYMMSRRFFYDHIGCTFDVIAMRRQLDRARKALKSPPINMLNAIFASHPRSLPFKGWAETAQIARSRIDSVNRLRVHKGG